MTKTIIFLSRLFYPHIGGVEKHVLEISKILIKKGYKVTVITEQHDPKLKLRDSIQGIEIYRIPVGRDNWFKKFRIWKWLWNHQGLIKQANIVHAHDVFFWYLPFKFLFPKKTVYTTFHGYEGNDIPSKKAIFMHKLAEKLSKGNICVGDYLKIWYGTKPNYVTYGGVKIRKIRNSKFEIRNKFKIQNSKFKIVFVGRLEEETGIMEYLKAIKMLEDKGYNIKLTVLGDGKLRFQAERFCNTNKLDVDFKGFVSNIFDYLVNSDFVFTSRYLGILEALFAKKLVFAVYNNEIKKDYLEMAPFAKFIVIANSKEELVSKILYSLNHTYKRKAVVGKAFKWIKMQSWQKVSQLYLNLWRGN